LITQYEVLDGNPVDEQHVIASLKSHKQAFGCESAPKWDPFSSPGKHLISERKLDRGGVRIGADRDPAGGGLSRLDQRLMLKSAGVPLRC
jgi:hypothetical protein